MHFRYAHAAHPDWAIAVEECLLQLGQQISTAGFVREPNLGFLYLTYALVRHADQILSTLKARTGVSSWVGASGAGVCATGVEYTEEPALAVMLGQFAPGTFNVFSGTQRPPALDARTQSGRHAAWTALVHADPATPDLPAMLEDMAHKLASGQLFGGAVSGRHDPVQVADQLLHGGLSGVVFSEDVALCTALTQGCFPLRGARAHEVTAGHDQKIISLDRQRAFDVLLADAGLEHLRAAGTANPRAIDMQLRNAIHALARQGLFVGLRSNPIDSQPPSPDDDDNDNNNNNNPVHNYLVRHIVALDPGSGALVTTTDINPGQHITFCTRDEAAARKDLVRMCAQIREEAAGQDGTPRALRGAVYVSCLGRGGHLFGEQGEELRLIQAQLGPVPLVGFYANGEISGRNLYSYSGVLSVFLA